MDDGIRRRALVAGALGLAAVVSAVVLYHYGPGMCAWWPGCTFYRVTGWYCPGCGMTRAMHALLHGRVAAAHIHSRAAEIFREPGEAYAAAARHFS